jgi:SAM-dependent methyltransferase
MPERLEPSNQSEWRQFGHQHVQRYRFALQRSEGNRVLDLACGVGYGSYILSQARGREVTGIDLSAEAIRYGQAHYQRPGLRLVQADALAWQNDGAAFDTIVSFETIEHLPDPAAFVAQTARLLKPGGLLIVSAPNTLQFKKAPVPVDNEFHLNEPDYPTLCGWLRPWYAIEEEWEQSPVLPPGGEDIGELRRELDEQRGHWWLRAANRGERILRGLTGTARISRPAARSPAVALVTDVFPLLPERRPHCEVFILVCRRTG